MSQFVILPAQEKLRITASVGFVSPVGHPDTHIIARNKRGWDIPGGHVEQGEDALAAFTREVMEETACTIAPGIEMVAVLGSVQHPGTGIAVFRSWCTLAPFTPTAEIAEVRIVSEQELLELYFGDKELLRELLQRSNTLRA